MCACVRVRAKHLKQQLGGLEEATGFAVELDGGECLLGAAGQLLCVFAQEIVHVWDLVRARQLHGQLPLIELDAHVQRFLDLAALNCLDELCGVLCMATFSGYDPELVKGKMVIR